METTDSQAPWTIPMVNGPSDTLWGVMSWAVLLAEAFFWVLWPYQLLDPEKHEALLGAKFQLK
jgi:hypothetical protein